MDLEMEDESVRIAVRALGAMRSSGGGGASASASSSSGSGSSAHKGAGEAAAHTSNRSAQTPSSSTSTSTSHTPALSLSMSNRSMTTLSSPPTPPPTMEEDDDSGSKYPSLARMQSLPLVSGALRVYEAGKANSRVVQYTSELVSSSLRHASSRLPLGSGERIDEFAGGVLDRIDRYRGATPVPATSRRDKGSDTPESPGVERAGNPGKRRWEGPEEGGDVPPWMQATSPFVPAPPPPPAHRDRRKIDVDSTNTSPTSSNAGEERQVARRSGWQAMLLEAGGLSAALSDESMRKLRYCLQWLQYATQHIDAQILILRDFIASLPGHPSSASAGPEVTAEHLRTLTHLRTDIVHTVRQVVSVVSKYAGGALPEPARGRVRGFILDLPKRFSAEAPSGGDASTVTGVSLTGTGTAARRGARRERGSAAAESPRPVSPIASRPGSPHLHMRPAHHHAGHHRRGASNGSTAVEAAQALTAAQRVLVLATESLDMMRGVTTVVSESLDRADAWVDRLRTVGIQRGMDGLNLPDRPGSGATPAWDRSGTASPGPSSAASPGAYSSAPSPGIGLGAMSLGSRYSTPPPEDAEDDPSHSRRGGTRMDVDQASA
ncbi:unnamed protein product [Mycena citricolor]|uniref:Opi1-domain-containing protein n=1 Tax=Mycena citricolor TaxID=2018698 RepID=A0AAD2HX16_9AGAR|nr:unnamed protein product [Mycena citricolor]